MEKEEIDNDELRARKIEQIRYGNEENNGELSSDEEQNVNKEEEEEEEEEVEDEVPYEYETLIDADDMNDDDFQEFQTATNEIDVTNINNMNDNDSDNVNDEMIQRVLDRIDNEFNLQTSMPMINHNQSNGIVVSQTSLSGSTPSLSSSPSMTETDTNTIFSISSSSNNDHHSSNFNNHDNEEGAMIALKEQTKLSTHPSASTAVSTAVSIEPLSNDKVATIKNCMSQLSFHPRSRVINTIADKLIQSKPRMGDEVDRSHSNSE